MREGAADDILAGEADRRPLDQQRGERQCLGMAPVDAVGCRERTAPLLQLADQLRMHREARRPGEQLLVERGDHLRRERGVNLPGNPEIARRLHHGARTAER